MATCVKIGKELQKSSSELQRSQEITEVLGKLQTSRLDTTAVTCRKHLEGTGRVAGAAGDGGVYWNPLVPAYERTQIGKLVI